MCLNYLTQQQLYWAEPCWRNSQCTFAARQTDRVLLCLSVWQRKSFCVILRGKCMCFSVWVIFQKLLKVSKYNFKVATFVARCFLKNNLLNLATKVLKWHHCCPLLCVASSQTPGHAGALSPKTLTPASVHCACADATQHVAKPSQWATAITERRRLLEDSTLSLILLSFP